MLDLILSALDVSPLMTSTLGHCCYGYKRSWSI